jgi:hypothetical protein
MFQSNEEMYRVFVDWLENVVPTSFPNLILNDHSGKLISEYVISRGVVSIGTLNAAVAALGTQLEHKRVKSQAELSREFDAKERARIKREAAENVEGAKKFNNLDLPKASDLEAKHQADAKKAIDALIARFSVNGKTPGTYDGKKTEAGRAALRAIQLKGESTGQVDWVLTLKIVGAAFHHETVAEIRAAAQKELDSWTNKDENQRRKAEEGKWGTVSLGNLPRYI